MSSRRGGADSLEEDVDSTTERSRRPRIHLDSPEMRARAKKIILQCCDEIDSLPLDPKTGKVYIIDHWVRLIPNMVEVRCTERTSLLEV